MNEENDSVIDLAEKIFEGETNSNFLGLSSAHLQNVAFYDFSEYQYILEPDFREPEEEEEPSEELPSTSDDPIEKLFLQDISIRIGDLIRENSKHTYKVGLFNEKPKTKKIDEAMRLDIIQVLISHLTSVNLVDPTKYEGFVDLYRMALEVVDIDTQEFINWLPIIPEGEKAFIFFYRTVAQYRKKLKYTEEELIRRWDIIIHLTEIEWRGKLERLLEEQEALEKALAKRKVKKVIPEYSFMPYLPNSWNLGLKIIYRQEWRPLGNQRGEIVKTIPLGPKQIEKVSTKIVRRQKLTRTAENLKSIEESSELTDTTKDSSEIMKEASSTFGWNIEAQASMGFSMFANRSISGGAHGEAEKRSKQTSSHLSESVQKMASKIKTETKTVVSTESESTYEVTTASEITNPNEEIPITYVYSKLLRQYEIFTSAVEIQSIIMIAEPIPHPHEINFEWVKRHDWILAKVLLDDSFRETLTSISQSTKPIDYSQILSILESKLGDILGTKDTPGFLERLTTKVTSLSLAGVDITQEAQKNFREALQKAIEAERELDILETSRERFYQHIRDNILHYCRAIWSQEDPQQRILRYKKGIGEKGQSPIYIPTLWDFYGTLGGEDFTTREEDELGEDTIDLTLDDLLEKIKEFETDESEATTFDLVGEFRSNDDTLVEITELINPIGPIGYYGNYAIYNLKPEIIDSELFTMLQIMKTPYLYYQSEDNENPIFMDPELKRITQENFGKGPTDDNEKLDMIEYVPNLRVLQAAANEAGEEELDDFLDNEELFIEFYPEYLFRKERSRRFLLDTQNLLIDIQPGAGSALENFKLAHRGVDVLKVLEEKKALELDNERRKNLIDKGKFHSKYWPGVEKVVIIDDGKDNSDEEAQEGDSGAPYSGPVDHPIKDVKKLKRLIAKLEELGIEGTLKLLQTADTAAERRKMIQLLEVTEKELKEIIAVIDLMRIRGLSEENAELLDAIGVNSVKELSRRNAKNLFKRLEEYGKQQRKKVPNESKIQEWIEQAKMLS